MSNPRDISIFISIFVFQNRRSFSNEKMCTDDDVFTRRFEESRAVSISSVVKSEARETCKSEYD